MKAAPIAMAVPAATALDRTTCDAKRCSILLLLFCDTPIFRHQKATQRRLPNAERWHAFAVPMRRPSGFNLGFKPGRSFEKIAATIGTKVRGWRWSTSLVGCWSQNGFARIFGGGRVSHD